jgi:hypothetical protein
VSNKTKVPTVLSVGDLQESHAAISEFHKTHGHDFVFVFLLRRHAERHQIINPKRK